MSNQTLTVQALSCMRQQKEIFAKVSFTVKSGELLWVQGENGCGKSSLLRILAGLLTPTEGSILWKENPSFHYVGHMNGLKLGLTVEENVFLLEDLYARNAHMPCELLEELALGHAFKTVVKYLSAGQKRRFALAKLLMFPRHTWLLDEPFTSLDQTSRQFFTKHLEKHLASGMAIISSHEELPFAPGLLKTLRLFTC